MFRLKRLFILSRLLLPTPSHPLRLWLRTLFVDPLFCFKSYSPTEGLVSIDYCLCTFVRAVVISSRLPCIRCLVRNSATDPTSDNQHAGKVLAGHCCRPLCRLIFSCIGSIGTSVRDYRLCCSTDPRRECHDLLQHPRPRSSYERHRDVRRIVGNGLAGLPSGLLREFKVISFDIAECTNMFAGAMQQWELCLEHG